MKDTDNTFEWNDELVKEFVHRTFAPSDPNHAEVNEFLDKFKQSKLPPLSKDKERIEVSHLWQHDNFRGNGNDAFWYQFCTSKPIEHINNSNLKQAIESALNEDTVASYDGVYFKTKQGARLYTQKEVDDMIKEACKEKDNGLSLPDDYIDDMGRLKIQFANGEKKSVEELIKEFNSQPLAFYSPPKRYSQSEVDAIREELDFAICYLKAFVDLNKGGIKADETSKDAQKIIDNYEAKHKPLTKDKGKDSKEWEIVSYKGKSTEFIYTLINNEWTPKNGYVPFQNNKEGIEKSGCEIHSVKRLSDNEVFTVGGRDSDGFLITRFNIIGNKIEVGLDYGSRKISLTHLQPQLTNGKTVTDNSDVACISINNIMEYFRIYFEATGSMNPTHGDIKTHFEKFVNQKLKTHTP